MNATATFQHNGVSVSESLADHAQRVVQSVFQTVAKAHQRRVTITQLTALDDRQLRDIGIDRSDIEQVVDAAL